MNQNPNSQYGRMARPIPDGIGNIFAVCASASALQSVWQEQIPADAGLARVHATYTAALALCTAGQNDTILVSADYTTAPTAAEIASAEAKGVNVIFQGRELPFSLVANRVTAALPGNTTGALFTVTGRVKVTSITGVITSAMNGTATNLKLVAVPTDQTNLTTQDISANLAVASLKANTMFGITGTVTDALVNQTAGAFNPQASSIIVQPGTISATTSATNTAGSVRWRVEYQPLEPGAFIYAA